MSNSEPGAEHSSWPLVASNAQDAPLPDQPRWRQPVAPDPAQTGTSRPSRRRSGTRRPLSRRVRYLVIGSVIAGIVLSLVVWLSVHRPLTEVTSTDGLIKLHIGESGWRLSDVSTTSLIQVVRNPGDSIVVTTEPWPNGVAVSPDTVLVQAQKNTPPDFITGPAPTITALGQTAYGIVVNRSSITIYNWYVAPTNGQAYSIVLVSASGAARTDEIRAWLDGALTRA